MASLLAGTIYRLQLQSIISQILFILNRYFHLILLEHVKNAKKNIQYKILWYENNGDSKFVKAKKKLTITIIRFIRINKKNNCRNIAQNCHKNNDNDNNDKNERWWWYNYNNDNNDNNNNKHNNDLSNWIIFEIILICCLIWLECQPSLSEHDHSSV